MSFYPGDVATDTVEAAPADAFPLTSAVELPTTPGIRIERGTVAFIDGNGKLVPAAVADAGAQPGMGLRLFNAFLSLGFAREARDARSAGASATVPGPSFPASPFVEALHTGRYETLSLRRSSVVIHGLLEGPETLTDVTADISLKRRGIATIKGTGLLRGRAVTLDAIVNIAAAERREGALHRLPLKLSLKGEQIDLGFDGRMVITPEGVELLGQGELGIPSGRGLARWFGAYWPTGPGLRDLSVRGQVRMGKQTLTFENAVARMDGNEGTGVLGLHLREPRPMVTGTLAFKFFDAKPYLTSAASYNSGPLSWSSLAAGVLTVPLGMHLDADLRISAEKVQLGAFELGRAAVTIALKDGRLLADIADLRFNGGEGGGLIMADFNGFPPRVNLRGKLEETDLGLLSSTLAGAPVLQGRAGIVLDLAGSGYTLQELLKGLGGKVVVRGQTPGRLGLDLRGLAGAARENELTGWGAAMRGTTGYDGLELRLVLRDGTLLTETAEARGADGVWQATGVVNLLAERIDLRVSQSAPGQPGVAVRRAPQTVIELRGPLREPHVKALTGP